MAHIEGEITIDRPVAEVFDFVADERNEPRYNPRIASVRKTTSGPIGVGTTFTAQAMTNGWPVELTIRTTGYDRPRWLESSTALSGLDIHGTLSFDPRADGTVLRWSWDVTPHGLLRFVTPLIAHLGRRQERRVWTGLKEFLEAGSGSAAAAAG